MTLLWEQCLAAFLQEKYARSQSEATVSAYRSMLNLFFGRLTKSPELVTHEDVVSFVLMPTCGRTQHGTAPSASTKNQRLQAIRTFFSYAARFEVIDGYGKPHKLFCGSNPADGISRSKVIRRPRALTDDEIARLFSVVPRDTIEGKRDRAIFLVFLYTARRRQEVLNLRYGDITWGSVTDDQGQTRYAWVYQFAYKGSGGQMVTRELPLPAYQAITAYLEASGRLPLAPDDPLFVAGYSHVPHDPYTALTGHAVAHRLKQYARKAGLDPSRVHPHVFRHTGARIRYEFERDVLKIQKLLMHANLSTTQFYLESLIVSADSASHFITERFGHALDL